jgi:serine/threonine protein kinase
MTLLMGDPAPPGRCDAIWKEASAEDVGMLEAAAGLGTEDALDATQKILSQELTQEIPADGSDSHGPPHVHVEAWGKLVSTRNPAEAYLLCGDPPRRFTVGRAVACDIVVPDQGVSLAHCSLYRATLNGVLRSVLCDTSTNGTYLNGKRLARDHEYELANGDEVTLCQRRRKRLHSAIEPDGAPREHRFIFRDLLHIRRHQRLRSVLDPRQPTAAAGDVIYFQKGQEIGRGGCGTVSLGMNVSDGTLLALKQVPYAPGTDTAVAALEHEIAVLSDLRHPQIVQYLGTARSENALTVLLEFVPGGSLASLLSKFGPFHEPVVRVYLQQILQGLEFLHSRDVVHGDIKPANILVSVTGGIKVSDFGASFKASQVSGDGTAVMGTAHYMAPEAIRSGSSSAAADVWAVGCTMIEMATARRPWSERDFSGPWVALHHIVKGTDAPAIPSTLSPAASLLTASCLHLSAANRPSCSELLRYPFIIAVPSPPPNGSPITEVPSRRAPAPGPAPTSYPADGMTNSLPQSDMTLHSEFLRERSFGHRAVAAAAAGVEPSQASTDEPTDLISVPSPPAPIGPQSSTGVTALVERLGFDSTNGPLPFPTP